MGYFDQTDINELILNKDIDGLVNCLESGDAPSQFQAAEALAQFGNWKGFAFLIISLRHHKSAIRGAAAETLGILRDPRAIPALTRVLQDADPEVHQAAVDALYAINTPEALTALAGMDKKDASGWVANEENDYPSPTIEGAILGGSQPEQPVIHLLNTEALQAAEKHFILASNYYEEDRFTQALTETNLVLELSPRSAEASNLKGLILEALGEHYQALVAYKKAIFFDQNFLDARENLENLKGILDLSSTPLQELLDGLSSEEWDMRRDAVAALAVREEPEALHAIIRALSDEDLEVQAFVMEALECSSEVEAAEAVQRYISGLMGDEMGEVQSGEDTPQAETDYQIQAGQTPAEKPVEIPEHRSAREYIEAASNLIDDSEDAQAYVQCQLALFCDPNNSDAWNMLGIIHEEDEEYRQAYFCYKMAVSCDPSFEEARSNLNEILQEYGGETTNASTLFRDLASGEDELIYDAIVNLGELNDPESIEHLQDFLKHPLRKIVLAAIHALGNLRVVEAAGEIALIHTGLWYFLVSPERMTLDQISDSRDQCISDWSDRCKILLALGKLGEISSLVRSIEREFKRIEQLSQAFAVVGIDDFTAIHQTTLDLSRFILEKYFDSNKLKQLRVEMTGKQSAMRPKIRIIQS